MMSGVDSSSLANTMIRLHSVISRSIRVIQDGGRIFADESLYRSPLRRGFIAYGRSFASVFYAHLLSEEEIVFPYFRDRLPHAPFGLMRTQHEEMVPSLYAVQEEIDEMECGLHPVESLARLTEAALRLSRLWYSHVALEETIFNARALAATMTQEEDLLLSKLMAEHRLANSGPDYLVVPFILYTLSPEERAGMMQELPPMVTQQLLPGRWKQKWAVMAPFLSAQGSL